MEGRDAGVEALDCGTVSKSLCPESDKGFMVKFSFVCRRSRLFLQMSATFGLYDVRSGRFCFLDHLC